MAKTTKPEMKPETNSSVGIAFRLQEETRNELRAKARANGVTVSTYVRLVVQDALKREVKIETAVLVLA